MTYRTAIVSRIRVEPGPLLDQLLKTMPSFKFSSKRGRNENVFGHSGEKHTAITYEEREGGGLAFYGLAPIQYPDGKRVCIGYCMAIMTDSYGFRPLLFESRLR